MTIRTYSCLFAASFLALGSNAFADEVLPASTEAPLAPPTAGPGDALSPPPPAPRVGRGRFSGGRFVVEMLGSAALGTLAGYGLFRATGGDGAGPAALGLTTEIAVTPLVVYGIGRGMGGGGSLGSTYYGALIGLAAPGTSAAATDNWNVTMAIGLTLMPVTSALFYELSSNARTRNASIAIVPTVDPQGRTGVYAGLAFEL